MTYNKKQMQPLIDKFQINPETNKLFIKVVEMFDGQPNYQIWAVKAIFNKAMADFSAEIWVQIYTEKRNYNRFFSNYRLVNLQKSRFQPFE